MGIIYQLINKIDGQTYIGSTTLPLNKIWKHHIDSAMRMSPLLLHREMRKHKNHNFMPKEVCDCHESELESKKEHYIKELNAHDVDTEVEEEIIIEKPKEKKLVGFQNAKYRGNGKTGGIKLMGWNIETGEERYWDSAMDAAEELTGNKKNNSNILSASRRGIIAYGHRWKMTDRKSGKRKIVAIDKRTWQEYYFNSCADAIRAVGNVKGAGLYKALKSNGRNTWRGYIWKYL